MRNRPLPWTSTSPTAWAMTSTCAISRKHICPNLLSFRPDFVFYVAGADPFMEDQLGGLLLTKEGLMRRDRLVLETARRLDIPVACALAGGYAFQVRDTVEIHANTVRVAAQVALAYPPRTTARQ